VSGSSSTISLASAALFPDARVEQRGGYLDVFGPDRAWAQAISLSLPATSSDRSVVGLRLVVDLEVLAGTLGVFAAASDGTKIGQEAVVLARTGRTAVVLDVPAAITLCFRNGDTPPARAHVHGVRAFLRRRFDLTNIIDPLLCSLLKEPGSAALAEVALALSRQEGRVIETDEIGELSCGGPPNPIPFEQLWHDEIGREVLRNTNALVDLLSTYDPNRMDPRNGYLGRDFFGAYLKQSIIRVYHCVRQLREAGINGGAVLDVGSLFGQFAVTLQRLGYRVTAVDRYRTYHGALDGYVEFMTREGIEVISTTRENELEAVTKLGEFDAVLSMAVIEHIPHTPRLFLESLASHVAAGGLLVMDTPNIARYWNRRHMAMGESIHQPIENQYLADVPYEGHHREYTKSEMIWMFEQVGCHDIRTRLFDYNLLQFSDLWPDHREALLAMTVDPTLADTILISGAIGAKPPARSQHVDSD
jgi:2-polyprenyl-3-methyl-5-hydroxy-6-metoxy-1,4-benzoquinol methylase